MSRQYVVPGFFVERISQSSTQDPASRLCEPACSSVKSVISIDCRAFIGIFERPCQSKVQKRKGSAVGLLRKFLVNDFRCLGQVSGCRLLLTNRSSPTR